MLKRTAILVFVATAVYSYGNAQNSKGPSISKRQGVMFLQMLDTMQIVGLRNYEESGFHLCNLAACYFENDGQRKEIRLQLERFQNIREKRDSNIHAALRETDKAARLNEYEAAKLLYLVAAGQMLVNFFEEKWDGNEFSFVTRKELKSMLPELKWESPGYEMSWDIVPGSQLMFIKAKPKDYGRQGSLSFLLTNTNGIVHLLGGDLGGGAAASKDPRVRFLDLRSFTID